MRISSWGLTVACISLCFSFAALGNDSEKLPGVNQLPIVQELPNPFVMNDGSPVKTKKDWAKRRDELKKLILGYDYGHVPAAGEVRASEDSSGEDAELHATVKQ